MKSDDLRNRLDKIIPETAENEMGLAADVRVLIAMLEYNERGYLRIHSRKFAAIASVCDELIGRWENDSKAFIEYDSWVDALSKTELEESVVWGGRNPPSPKEQKEWAEGKAS